MTTGFLKLDKTAELFFYQEIFEEAIYQDTSFKRLNTIAQHRSSLDIARL